MQKEDVKIHNVIISKLSGGTLSAISVIVGDVNASQMGRPTLLQANTCFGDWNRITDLHWKVINCTSSWTPFQPFLDLKLHTMALKVEQDITAFLLARIFSMTPLLQDVPSAGQS